MLKSLSTLIKVNKAQLDEKRKELAAFLDKKQKCVDEIKAMEDSIKFEAENLIKLHEDFRPMFLTYLEATRVREGQLLDEIDKLNPHINRISDEIREIFSEMKKFEIVKENRENEIEAEMMRKTQMEIDEIAMLNFVRKTDFEYYN